ncbi:MAG: hypothetical protein QXS38_00725 [Candidatus Pacearchaeota archaeon]
MEKDMHLVYWAYNKLLWMLAGCILLLGVWVFTCANILMIDNTLNLTGFLFIIAFIAFAVYIWEKREFYSRQLQEK